MIIVRGDLDGRAWMLRAIWIRLMRDEVIDGIRALASRDSSHQHERFQLGPRTSGHLALPLGPPQMRQHFLTP